MMAVILTCDGNHWLIESSCIITGIFPMLIREERISETILDELAKTASEYARLTRKPENVAE